MKFIFKVSVDFLRVVQFMILLKSLLYERNFEMLFHEHSDVANRWRDATEMLEIKDWVRFAAINSSMLYRAAALLVTGLKLIKYEIKVCNYVIAVYCIQEP